MLQIESFVYKKHIYTQEDKMKLTILFLAKSTVHLHWNFTLLYSNIEKRFSFFY